MDLTPLVEDFLKYKTLPQQQMEKLLSSSFNDIEVRTQLMSAAREISETIFNKKVFIRGLIEFTNYCRNDCYYCGIRKGNTLANRYHLTKEEILRCCELGHNIGFRTFVLQGGEDLSYSDKAFADIIASIKTRFPDTAITLSVGERDYTTYKLWRDAGADRYLLRHETASTEHYAQLHPSNLSLEHRLECLQMLKELKYQVGTGFMVGSPGQTLQHITADLAFIEKFQPQMIGIGPFIPHSDTPFKNYTAGTLEQTLTLLAVLRIMLPNVLLPSTTALGTIASNGREQGILAGANVVMPNLSPIDVRQKYLLYNNKLSSGAESAEAIADLERRLNVIGYSIDKSRGDYKI